MRIVRDIMKCSCCGQAFEAFFRRTHSHLLIAGPFCRRIQIALRRCETEDLQRFDNEGSTRQ